MNKVGKITVVVALLVVVGMVLAHKQRNKSPATEMVKPPTTMVAGRAAKTSTPRLLDLGADRCVPCRMMAPILAELKEEYVGKLEIQFIDVWKNPDAARQHGIRAIPTQIFYDASGQELFRHQGFMSKKDILMKWKDLGFDFQRLPSPFNGE